MTKLEEKVSGNEDRKLRNNYFQELSQRKDTFWKLLVRTPPDNIVFCLSVCRQRGHRYLNCVSIRRSSAPFVAAVAAALQLFSSSAVVVVGWRIVEPH